jgi:hypothetical protein
MPKTAIDRDVFKAVGAVRDRVTRELSNLNGSSAPADVRKAAKRLRTLADQLEDRVTGGSKQRRQAAARKAARTRQQKARSRSQAAKKGARTRARA